MGFWLYAGCRSLRGPQPRPVPVGRLRVVCVPWAPRASVASWPLPAVAALWPCQALHLGVSSPFFLIWRCPQTSACLRVRWGAASRRVLPFSVPSVHLLVFLLTLNNRELFPELSAGTLTASDGA